MVRCFPSDRVFTKTFFMGVMLSCVEKGAELQLVAVETEQGGELGLVLFCATNLVCEL